MMEFLKLGDQWASLLIVLPLLGAFIIPFLYVIVKNRKIAPVVAILMVASGLVVSLDVLIKVVSGHTIEVIMGGYMPPIGINWKIDIWGATLTLLIFFIGFLATIYSVGYLKEELWVKYFSTMQVMIAGAVGVSLTGDLFNMFVFLEVASISAYILVSTDATETTLEASFKYLVLGSMATSFILLGIALLYGGYHTLNIYDIADKIGNYPVLDIVAVSLLLIGLGVEGAMFPLNSWLPDAHPSAPSPISAMLSGTLIKIGLIGLVRVLTIASHAVFFDKLLMFILIWGILTSLWGELSALRQKDIKRLLAHSSSAQMGYIVSALSTFTPVGIAAGIIHMVVHALSKALLFMASGIFIEKARSREIESLEGVGRDISGGMFTFGTLSLMGLPPLPGFFSKFLILIAVYSKWGWLPTSLILLAASVEVFYYLRLISVVLGQKGSNAHKHTGMVYMTISTVVLGLTVLLVGFMPGVFQWLVSVITSIDRVLPYHSLWSVNSFTYSLVALVISAVITLIPMLRDIGIVLGIVSGSYALYSMWQDSFTVSFLIALFVYIAIVPLLFAQIGGGKDSKKNALVMVAFASILLVLSATSSFVLLYYWELMSVFAFFMFLTDPEKAFSGVVYSTFMTILSYIFMLGIVSAFVIGGSYQISGWSVAVAGVSIAIAMAFKLGMFPLHVWADYGYQSAHPVVAGYLSGAVSKVAFFLLFMASLYAVLPLKLSYLLVLLAGITIVWAGYRAIVSDDLLGILAYSSISQMAYVLAGVLIGGSALSGAWLHALGHAVFETGLFIVAYVVFVLYGTTNIEELRGKGVSPVLFYLATLLFMSLAGIPPLSGFVSKWLLYQGALTGGYFLVAILMMIGSAMSMMYGLRFIIAIYGKYEKGMPFASLSLAIYSVITLVLGVYPWLFFKHLKVALAPFNKDVPLTWKELILGTQSGGRYTVALIIGLFVFSVILFLIFYAMGKGAQKKGKVFRGGAFYEPTDENIPALSDMLWPMGRVGGILSYFDVWHKATAALTETIADTLRGIYSGYLPDYALYVSLTLLIVVQFIHT